MSESPLNALETDIDELIGTLQQLRSDNLVLRNQLANSARQRSELQSKMNSAATKIQYSLTQLKELQS